MCLCPLKAVKDLGPLPAIGGGDGGLGGQGGTDKRMLRGKVGCNQILLAKGEGGKGQCGTCVVEHSWL